MEGLPGFRSSSSKVISKKPRSTGSRRPRSTENLTATPHIESIPSAAHYNDANLTEGYKRKELYLNGFPTSKKNKRDDRGRVGNASGSGRSTEGALMPANWKGPTQQDEHAGLGSSADNKLRKVKLKVGGVTRTIHAKAGNENGEGSANRNKTKGEFWFSNTGKGDAPDKNHAGSSSEPVRKSRRVPKRRSLDSDDDQDPEARYLEKNRVSRTATHSTTEFEDSLDEGTKRRKVSKVNTNGNNNGNGKGGNRTLNYEVDEDFAVSRMGRDSNNRKRNKEIEQSGDFIEGEEAGSDGGSDAKLTSRQRAMQGKGGNGDSLIEFPNGLPPAPSRKQKEKLSEVEIQAKKAEAAQRRKMQVEKAAKEAEAEAIRKILGLDSDKKKEEKKQKEREDKEKAAQSQINASNTIKWVIGPTGTVVTFPDDVGLPSILNSKPSSYPPPREKCAGPSCTNPYKYRDSMSNLPLCSLLCYKAVQGRSTNVHTLTC